MTRLKKNKRQRNWHAQRIKNEESCSTGKVLTTKPLTTHKVEGEKQLLKVVF